MALGANRGNVMRMILGDAMGLVLAGLVIGAPVAIWAKSIATNLIPDLPAKPWTSVALAATILIVIAVFAAFLPARRATRVDPIVALRYE